MGGSSYTTIDQMIQLLLLSTSDEEQTNFNTSGLNAVAEGDMWF
jgi:hypothetical protein